MLCKHCGLREVRPTPNALTCSEECSDAMRRIARRPGNKRRSQRRRDQARALKTAPEETP